ncbi:MAG: EAL and HDOD domain-containing protein [Vicinamibacterales bacterium]
MARQPIVTRSGRVMAYELLYRGHTDADRCDVDGDRASAQVLTDALLSWGIATVSNGLPLFLNFTQRLLLDEAALLLPAPSVVLEVTEDVPATEQTISACRHLHAAGYAVALDDFVEGSAAEAFIPFASYVKVDVLATPADRLAPLVQRFRPRGVRLIAEKVETQAVAESAAAAGYELFQGFFFARPATLTTHAVPPRRAAYLDLLAAIHDPDITIAELERLVKRDASLSHRVLRCLQSASWGLRHEVSSIREALILLGIEPVRKWTAIWSVAGLSGGGQGELVTMVLMRARMCEQIASMHWGPQAGAEYFLLGLCSLLDVLLQTNMAVALADLPLPSSILDALRGVPGRPRSVLDCVMAYEQGDWMRADTFAQFAGIATRSVPDAYGDALHWVASIAPATHANG